MNFQQEYAYKFPEVNKGDIFYSSWGYDMTNVDFYKCTGKSGKATIFLAKIGTRLVKGDGWSGEVEPDPSIVEETFSVRIKKNGGMHGKWDHEDLIRWDGKPKYFNHMD